MSKSAFPNALLFCIFRLLFILFAVFTLLFFLQRLTGDPVTMLYGHGATPEAVEAARHDLGLDRPVLVQYAIFHQKA